ncbi:hypothetical protein H0H81_003369 [Sphagnurus paluster]|uniref:Protein kinase domain-containing protein n=1 Tax=Sphagnurus paluster TaxID=117069 RepID=A0A9P7K2M6_9AGAR|nr:hypothetical protein H0H81_003369 [Sphagnurus paluster]
MAHQIAGPMPPSDFLEEFLPKTSSRMPRRSKSYFSSMSTAKREADMYPEFIKLVEESKLMGTKYKIVDTSNSSDRNLGGGWKIKPDPTMYRVEVDTELRATQWAKAEINYEFKLEESADPFNDPGPEDTRSTWRFTSTSIQQSKHRGQLLHYATEWLNRSHRCFAFTIFVAGRFMRFIRWDRAGAIVSERFDYLTDGRYFFEFLWRYTHLEEAERGFDTTVRLATAAEEKLGKAKLSEWAPEDKETPVFVFEVPAEDGDEKHEFIAWGSMAHPESLTGRCTRAYPVYEAKSNELYFLKDGWRAHELGAEADILRDLCAHKVPNIPEFFCGGDIEQEHHATLTDLFVPIEEPRRLQQPQKPATDTPTDPPPVIPVIDPSKPRPVHLLPYPPRRSSPWLCGRRWSSITRRIHHRFVVRFIGKPLSSFSLSKLLLKYVADAFKAHEKAYKECGYIHRDISARNILIHKDGRGILNDWDLAKKESELQQCRRHEKTGTWQFMSCLLLMDHHPVHTIQDDMESFVYVVLYHGLRYLSHNKPKKTLSIMRDIFDYEEYDVDGERTGGSHKKAMIRSFAILEEDFHLDSKPLDQWLRKMFKMLREWIEFVTPTVEEVDIFGDDDKSDKPSVPTPTLSPHLSKTSVDLSDHTKMAEIFAKALDRGIWPENDAAVDSFPYLKAQERSSVKRALEEGQTASRHGGSGNRSSSKKSRTEKAPISSGPSMGLRQSTSHGRR